MPSQAMVTYTDEPTAMPNDETTPAIHPWSMLRATM
jgi:hypothetical protein